MRTLKTKGILLNRFNTSSTQVQQPDDNGQFYLEVYQSLPHKLLFKHGPLTRSQCGYRVRQRETAKRPMLPTPPFKHLQHTCRHLRHSFMHLPQIQILAPHSALTSNERNQIEFQALLASALGSDVESTKYKIISPIHRSFAISFTCNTAPFWNGAVNGLIVSRGR